MYLLLTKKKLNVMHLLFVSCGVSSRNNVIKEVMNACRLCYRYIDILHYTVTSPSMSIDPLCLSIGETNSQWLI